MLPSEVEKIFRAFAEKRKAELPRFTPDGIPITLENKFDDAIYNYLYAYWKEQSGEYDPKDDEIIMTKENSFTKNEKKFEQWLFEQYGMTNKEQREYTFKGNLLSLGEIALSAWGIEGAGATKLVVPGKFLASNADDSAKKALQQDTIEDAVEGTLKKEVAEEVAENTAKKEIADTAEDLSQKMVDREGISQHSDIKEEIETSQTLLSGQEWYRYFQNAYKVSNVKWNISSFDDILQHPTSLREYTADEIADILGEGWTRSTYGSNGGGWKFIQDSHPDNMVFYHNGGGIHKGAYWGVKSGKTGTIKVVNANTYVPLPKDKAIIIYGEDW